MTESLLQKLEEKIMSLLAENEKLRHDLREVTQRNMSLEVEAEKSESRISEILSLFDSFGDQQTAIEPIVAEQAAG